MTAHEDLFTQLHRWLARPLAVGEANYLLIDHAALPALGAWLKAAEMAFAPLWGEVDSDKLHALPILLHWSDPLHPARQNLLRRLANHGQFATAITCLVSPLDFAALRQALADRCEAMLPDRMDVVLRYYDTRVLPELLAVLDETTQRAFLGFASALAYVDRQGQLTPLAVQYQSADWPTPLPLSEAQQNAMLEAATADAVLDLLQRQTPSQLRDWNPPQRYQAVCAAITHAQSLGLSALGDYALMTLLHRQYPSSTLESAAWQAGFARVQAGAQSLSELVTQMEAADAA